MAQTSDSFKPKPSVMATQVAAATQAMASADDPLPAIYTGISDYLEIKEGNALFVDKTALLQELVDLKRVFLGRPRRFGKTMLISMLKELFTNGTGQFEHWAIAELWREPRCPVVQLSFLNMSNPVTFEQDLCNKLRDAFFDAGFAEIYDFLPECHEFKVLAPRIVRQVLKGQKVVVLIDEWDDPLSSNLHDRVAFEANTARMRDFYTWLREGNFIKFMLVTGISRYQETSFFTGEFITDISLNSRFASLVGYTEAELRTYFAPYITRSAALCHMSEETLLEKIRLFYDGFCFDEQGQVRVYSPWSINCFFAQVAQAPEREPLFRCFWMKSSNAAQALRSFIKTHKPDLTFFNTIKDNGIQLKQKYILNSYNFDSGSYALILLQTGYLTIKEKVTDSQETTLADWFQYRCNFTNLEVEKEFIELVMAYVTGQADASIDTSMVGSLAQNLIDALRAHDMVRAVAAINSMLVRVHYDLWPRQSREAFYRVLIAFFLQILLDPPHVRQEVANNVGRSDIEAIVGNDLFVFELKLIPAKKKAAQSAAAADEAQAQSTEVDLDPPSLAARTRIARNAYDQLIGKSYGSSSFSPVIKHWYGVVLVISEVTRQVCYWRYFTSNQDLGCGAVEPESINNPPQFDTES